MDIDERVHSLLAHLLQQAKCAGDDYPYDALFVRTELHRNNLGQDERIVFHEETDADKLPYFRLETQKGSADIELCPFGPIALVSHEAGLEAERVEQLLTENGIAVVSPDDLAKMPVWNEAPVIDWLFPQRLSDVLALFDQLRTQYQTRPQPAPEQDAA